MHESSNRISACGSQLIISVQSHRRHHHHHLRHHHHDQHLHQHSIVIVISTNISTIVLASTTTTTIVPTTITSTSTISSTLKHSGLPYGVVRQEKVGQIETQHSHTQVDQKLPADFLRSAADHTGKRIYPAGCRVLGYCDVDILQLAAPKTVAAEAMDGYI